MNIQYGSMAKPSSHCISGSNVAGALQPLVGVTDAFSSPEAP
jgi:hypothetical protein